RRRGGRDGGRHGGHARAGVPAPHAQHDRLARRGGQGGAGAGVDADLPHDGGGALLPPTGTVPDPRPLTMAISRRAIVLAAGAVLLALVPPVAGLLNQPFYVDLFRRMMIFAIAALSLDLILGYGGMVSFGHAAYLGIGAYAVGIFAFYGVANGFLQWPAARRRALRHGHQVRQVQRAARAGDRVLTVPLQARRLRPRGGRVRPRGRAAREPDGVPHP